MSAPKSKKKKKTTAAPKNAPQSAAEQRVKKRTPAQQRAVWMLVLCIALIGCVMMGVLYFHKPASGLHDTTFTVQHGESPVNVHATVMAPETDGPMPLVVLCHGFTGNRGGDGHFPAMAERLAEAGIATIAVDFSGNGESEEPFTAYTLDNMHTDIDAAIHYMQTAYSIDADRIGLLGHSMGGRIVSLHLSEDIAAAALWAPADNTGLDGLEFLDHDPAGREALLAEAQANGSVALSGWNVTISREFIEQMADSDPWAAIRAYDGALLVAFAGGDKELLSVDTILGTLGAAAGRDQGFVNLYGSFEDATHNFTDSELGSAKDAEIRERIESATAEFFIEALAG